MRRFGGIVVVLAVSAASLGAAEVVVPATRRNAAPDGLDVATFFGGGRNDAAYAVAVDPLGFVYVAGYTSSLNFPIVAPLQPQCGSCGPASSDAFVAKLTADGATIVFSTYLGGSDIDVANGIALDRDGDIYVTGRTLSNDFPLMTPLQAQRAGGYDAFVTKITADGGTIVYSTYLGGRGDDNGEGIAVSSTESAHVVGSTASTDFPLVGALQPGSGGGQDGFIAKLDRSGQSLLYGTYLGGPGLDEARGVALDGARNVYVAGTLNGKDLVRLNPTGSQVVYEVSLPGPASDGRAVAVDAQGFAYLVGDAATCLPSSRDAILAKVDPSGATVFVRQMAQCSGDFQAAAVVADEAGGAILAGVGTSHAIETCPTQTYLGGLAENAFVAAVGSDGYERPLTNTLGGGNVDIAYGIARDSAGGVWIAGETRSPDFPVRAALQPSLAGPAGRPDGFVARLVEPPAVAAPVAGFNATNRSGLGPLTVSFSDASSCRVDAWSWTFGDGATSAHRSPTHTYTVDGAYSVSLTVSNSRGSDALTLADYVTVGPPIVADFTATPADGLLPLMVQFQSQTSGNVTSYVWDFGDGKTSTAENPGHVYILPGRYCVSLLAEGPVSRNTGYKSDFINAHEVKPDALITPRVLRPWRPVSFADRSQGTITGVAWSFGDATGSSLSVCTHIFAVPGYYTIGLRASGPSTTEDLVLQDHVLVSDFAAVDVVAAPGPDPTAPPRIAAFDVMGQPSAGIDHIAYGTMGYGANVGTGDVEGRGLDAILTGPGPGPMFGPQVRAFRGAAGPIAKIDFYAYGTMRHGAGVTGANVDGDPYDEIETSAGQGAAFGPHVRGFNYDNGILTPINRINFFAYQTLHYGVQATAGNIDGAGWQEILTAPGPGPAFGPFVRGFELSPLLQSIPSIDFFAFPELSYGARICTSALLGYGGDQILAGAGPGPSLLAHVKGFRYTAPSLMALPAVDFEAFPGGLYGAEPEGGDLDGDGRGEILVTRGPDPAAGATAKGFDWPVEQPIPSPVITAIPSLNFVPYQSFYGLHTATGDLGF